MNIKCTQTVARLAGAALLAAATAGAARADYPATLLSHGPLAYWPFNEPATAPAPQKLANSGTLGSVVDTYGNSQLINGVAGKVGNALSFSNPSGTGYLGSRADVVYNPGLSSKTFTVEFWARPSGVALSGSFDATGSSPISNFNPNNYPANRSGWLFYLAPTGLWQFRLGLTSGYAAVLTGSGGRATADTWQHIAATYDGTTVNLYADGVLIASDTSVAANTGWLPNDGSFLRFGGTPLFGNGAFLAGDDEYYTPLNQSNATPGNRGWDGLLDEVAIYPTVLSAETIAAHFAAGATPATYGETVLADSPAGYWKFDEAAVTEPDPGTLPTVANVGSLGDAADGTAAWGALTGEPGAAYPGFSTDNKSLTFDGLKGYVAVEDAPELHFTGNITLTAWVKPAARDNIRNIIGRGLDDDGSETFLRITRESGTDGAGYGTGYYYEVGASPGASADEYYVSAFTPIPAGDIGNWVFLAGTYDGTKWSLYRNGQLAATTETEVGAVDVPLPWTIGSRAEPSPEDGFYFAGSIDEPAIFDKSLSAQEILELYNAAQVAPVITAAPQNPGTVFKGDTVVLSVLAEGAPTLDYLWTSNGVPTGVTTTNYTITDIAVGTYTIGVIVANPYGTNSASVTFNAVTEPPTIVTQPSSSTRFVGYPFSLSVVADGTTPLTYFWTQGDTVVQSGPSPTFEGVASLALAGTYSVI
ncbi:MAG: hypothetical protein KIT22_06730, partial [Verrucomicrobiae bacterium]|nr:hypothetical protein [Verrucomicrobiae bacterium]